MNRRELLKLITAATGTAMIGSTGVIAGCASKEEAAPSLSFTEQDVFLLDEVAEPSCHAPTPRGPKTPKWASS